MPLDYDTLMTTSVTGDSLAYDAREAMLYALATGFGRDPLDRRELPFVVAAAGLHTVPTMASVLVTDSTLDKLGCDPLKILHGEQRLELHRPLPKAAELTIDHRVAAAYDLGERTGALILLESEARMKQDGTAMFTLGSTLLARGDGGFGGPKGSGPVPHALPDRSADLQCRSETRPDQALLFRLLGDYNPLHADPAFAKRAGFSAPILHGRCTYGVACHAILKTICDYDFTLIAGFDGRFTSPVYPGDVVTTDMWQDRNIVSFRCRVEARDVTVIDNGRCTLTA